MENDFKPCPDINSISGRSRDSGFERLIPCEVLVVNEPRVLSWRWGDEGSVVIFRLEAIAEGTRLTLEHTGLKGVRGLAMAWVLSHGWVHKIEQRLPAVLAQPWLRNRCERGSGEGTEALMGREGEEKHDYQTEPRHHTWCTIRRKHSVGSRRSSVSRSCRMQAYGADRDGSSSHLPSRAISVSFFRSQNPRNTVSSERA